jgi:Mrp family chromosome partitioning ATPase
MKQLPLPPPHRRLPATLSGGPLTPDDVMLRGSRIELLPGEVPPLSWQGPAPDQPALTPDPALMTHLATRALAAGMSGQTAVGVASPRHGDGATTVARSLAACLADRFGKRVVLLEGNARSPCLRKIYRLVDGPGLADVLARRVSLGGALQMAGEHRTMLVLPAALPHAGQASLGDCGLRDLVAALLAHADAVVVDLAPVLPYRDTAQMCPGLDGVALVVRGGHSTKTDGAQAVQAIRDGGAPVLGAVLNRERSTVPWLFARLL